MMMYNFSGVIFRIWGVCGIILLLGIVCVLMDKPWKKGYKLKRSWLGILVIIFAIVLGSIYALRVLVPGVSSYTGEFIDSHRDSRAAPPLPVTFEYVFWNGDGYKMPFYLDTFSKREIYPGDFIEGREYTIYYDEFTSVIVRVEECE